MHGYVSTVAKLLNVDGYQVLAVTDGGRTVALDLPRCASSSSEEADGAGQRRPAPRGRGRAAPRHRPAGLDLFAVGLGRFETAIDDELATAVSGGAVFKAVRGEYGSGKTFFARWLAERAKRRGMAATEIQISETETPLHRLETVYRRLVERLTTASYPPSALRDVVEAWFFTLEEEVLAAGTVPLGADGQPDLAALAAGVDELMEQRLADVARTTPLFASALRGCRKARLADDHATAEALLAWGAGSPTSARPPSTPPASRVPSTISARSASCRGC